MVVLVTSKNEDPIKDEGARALTSLYIDFSDAQTQLTPQSCGIQPKFKTHPSLWLSFIPSKMKIQSKMKALEC